MRGGSGLNRHSLLGLLRIDIITHPVIRSHSAGSGPEVEREVVRSLLLLRLSTMATGITGVRPELAQTYAAVLNAGITPVVHEYGSLGCSGDLAPLSHCALAVTGEGPVRDKDGNLTDAADALAGAGIAPIELREKEGLGLINGTEGMLGMLVLALADLDELLVTADIAAAMSGEGLLGTDRVFAADLQALRPHPGSAASAAPPGALEHAENQPCLDDENRISRLGLLPAEPPSHQVVKSLRRFQKDIARRILGTPPFVRSRLMTTRKSMAISSDRERTISRSSSGEWSLAVQASSTLQ